MPVSQPLAYLHSPVVVAFPLSFGIGASSYAVGLHPLTSWLGTSCVPRVACDFVSRLGGWDTMFFKDDWLKSSLEALAFEAEVLKLRHGYLLPLSWRMVPDSATHVVWVQAQVRTPPSNWLHEMAI